MSSVDLKPILEMFLISVPEGFFNLLAMLLFVRLNLKDNWGKIVLFTLFYIPFCAGSYYLAVKHGVIMPRLIAYAGVMVLLMRGLFFRDWTSSLAAGLIFFIATVISNMTGATLAIAAGITPTSAAAFNLQPHEYIYWWIAYISMPIMSVISIRYVPASWVEAYRHKQSYPETIAIIGLLFLQIVLVTAAMISLGIHGSDQHWVMAWFFVFFITTILIMLVSTQLSDHLSVSTVQNHLSSDMNHFLALMYQQQTDFADHADLMYDLLTTEAYEDMQSFLASLNQEIGVINETLKTGNPFLSAMLNAKLLEADNRRIRLETRIDCPVDGPSLSKYSLELIRVLTNLINNAMDAVENQTEIRRWIRIHIDRIGPLLRFTISNPVDDNIHLSDEIFQAGISSKGGEHSGMGLYIAHSLAGKMNGALKFGLDPGPEVWFTLLVPK